MLQKSFLFYTLQQQLITSSADYRFFIYIIRFMFSQITIEKSNDNFMRSILYSLNDHLQSSDESSLLGIALDELEAPFLQRSPQVRFDTYVIRTISYSLFQSGKFNTRNTVISQTLSRTDSYTPLNNLVILGRICNLYYAQFSFIFFGTINRHDELQSALLCGELFELQIKTGKSFLLLFTGYERSFLFQVCLTQKDDQK